MGKKNPVEKYPLLYINKRSNNLRQMMRVDDGKHFRIKDIKPPIISKTFLHKYYEFYGVIDRFGVVIRYRKEGRVWKKMETVAVHDGKRYKTVKESEDRVIQELNKMNRRNPELAFYTNQDKKVLIDKTRMEADENWESI